MAKDSFNENLKLPSYDGAQITNIHRGGYDRKHILYAQITDKNGMLLVNATLDYCVKVLNERLP